MPLALPAQLAGAPTSSWKGATGVADKVFALVSIAVVVAACVVATRMWIEPGWTRISIFALLYLTARALVGCLFEPGEALTARRARGT